MKRRPATPFDALLPGTRLVPPPSRGVTVVVAGQKIERVDQIEPLLVDAERDDDHAIAEARRLAEAVRRAKKRAHDAKRNADPEVKAKKQAWVAQHRDAVNASRRKWAKANPEKMKVYARRYYAQHAEALLERARERARARYAAVKAAREAAREAARQVEPATSESAS